MGCLWCITSHPLGLTFIPAPAAVTSSVQTSTIFTQVPLNNVSPKTPVLSFLVWGAFEISLHGNAHRNLLGTHTCVRLKWGWGWGSRDRKGWEGMGREEGTGREKKEHLIIPHEATFDQWGRGVNEYMFCSPSRNFHGSFWDTFHKTRQSFPRDRATESLWEGHHETCL